MICFFLGLGVLSRNLGNVTMHTTTVDFVNTTEPYAKWHGKRRRFDTTVALFWPAVETLRWLCRTNVH